MFASTDKFWKRNVFINFNEIDSPDKINEFVKYPFFQDRLMRTSQFLGLTPTQDMALFTKEMSDWFYKAKPAFIPKAKYIKTIDNIDLSDLLHLSEDSLLTLVGRFFHLSDQDVQDYLTSLPDMTFGDVIPVLVHFLIIKKHTPEFYFANLGQVNGYTRIGRLGKGSYGTVYKVIKADVIYAEKVVSTLSPNELDILCRFDHPNILKAIDYFHSSTATADARASPTSEEWHIILEYAPGSLQDMLSFSTNLDYSKRLMWCYQIASAMLFFHSQGYYHCDLKPENILISKDGNALVSDFGLAYPFEAALTVCGTTLWTAPEAVAEKFDRSKHHPAFSQPIIHRIVDIFSLGTIFVKILTGNSLIKPIQSDTSYIDVYERLIADFDGTVERALLKEQAWIPLIKRMCAIDVNRRVKSVQEVLLDPVFARANLSVPVSGGIITPVEKVLDFPKSTVENFTKIVMIFAQKKVHILTAFVGFTLYYRLSNYLLDRNVQNVYQYDLASISSFLMAQELTIQLDKISGQDWMRLYTNIKRDDLTNFYKLVPMFLKGVLRIKTVYDLAVSYDEALFGLYNIVINTKYSAEYLHEQYLKYEPPSFIMKRYEKDNFLEMSDFTVLNSDFKADMSISRYYYAMRTEKGMILGPAIVYQAVRGVPITKEMLETRFNELKRSTGLDEASKLFVGSRFEARSMKYWVEYANQYSVMTK